jgi:hypothetical protein
MDRRSFIAGLAALAASATVASPMLAPTSEADYMAQFREIWSRLDDDQREVCLNLLRGLSALPEGQNADHLYAEADRQLDELRQRRA